MFNNCGSISYIDLSNFNPMNAIDMKYMFGNCVSLKSINLENFNTKNVKYMN